MLRKINEAKKYEEIKEPLVLSTHQYISSITGHTANVITQHTLILWRHVTQKNVSYAPRIPDTVSTTQSRWYVVRTTYVI